MKPEHVYAWLNEYGLTLAIVLGFIAWALGLFPGPIQDPHGRYVP